MHDQGNKAVWASWMGFVATRGAQFESLSKEEKSRDQIQKFGQTRLVQNYIYYFYELQKKVPSMNVIEACSLFMYSLHPQQ